MSSIVLHSLLFYICVHSNHSIGVYFIGLCLSLLIAFSLIFFYLFLCAFSFPPGTFLIKIPSFLINLISFICTIFFFYFHLFYFLYFPPLSSLSHSSLSSLPQLLSLFFVFFLFICDSFTLVKIAICL